jgi:hypothetical protein
MLSLLAIVKADCAAATDGAQRTATIPKAVSIKILGFAMKPSSGVATFAKASSWGTDARFEANLMIGNAVIYCPLAVPDTAKVWVRSTLVYGP